MDERLKDLYDGMARDLYTAQDHELSRGECMVIATLLVSYGYRLDPYPNGKSKDELLAIIDTKQHQLDRARNFLRENHRAKIAILYAIDMEKHARINPDCPECKFLEETSNCPKSLELNDDGTTHEEVRS